MLAPSLPQGTYNDYDFKGRLEYDYSTSASAKILVLNENEYDRKKMLGEVGGSVDMVNTRGPIEVSVIGEYPIKVNNKPGIERTFYKIYFRNTGSGLPVTNGIDGKIDGKIKISEPSALLSCNGEQGQKEINLRDFILREGKEMMISCSVDIDRSQWTNNAQGTVNILFELEYRYYLDSQTSLTIKGEKDVGTV